MTNNTKLSNLISSRLYVLLINKNIFARKKDFTGQAKFFIAFMKEIKTARYKTDQITVFILARKLAVVSNGGIHLGINYSESNKTK